MPTSADLHVYQVLTRHSPRQVEVASLNSLFDTLRAWAGVYLLEFKWSGSYVKGTAVAGSSDIDLFISLRNDVLTGNTPTLKTLFNSLNNRLIAAGYTTRLQNVSIRIVIAGFCIDLIPAVKHPGNTNDHSLHKRKADTWTKTNVDTHVNQVRNSSRLSEIKALKIWRNLRNIDISSFYLELVVLRALSGRSFTTTADNLWEVLRFLSNDFVQAAIYDPANTNNCISDELNVTEKWAIASSATISRQQPTWGTVIW